MNKSIELCGVSGNEAASLLQNKIADPTLPIEVGGRILNSIVQVTHTGDGLAVILYDDDAENSATFQFAPTPDRFADTAVDIDGQPVCTDCTDS